MKFFPLLFILISCQQNSTYNGKFCNYYESGTPEICIDFFGKNKFSYTGINENVTEGKGTYTIKNSNLFLEFKKQKKQTEQLVQYIGRHNILEDTVTIYPIISSKENELILNINGKEKKLTSFKDEGLDSYQGQ